MRSLNHVHPRFRGIFSALIGCVVVAHCAAAQTDTNPLAPDPAGTNCATVLTAREATRCLGSIHPDTPIQVIQPDHIYVLPELIDLAEQASPEGRIAWASAKRSLERAGVDRALYLPLLTLVVQGSDLRAIVPFPKPIAPRGYVTVEEPTAAAQLQLEYTLLDFGRAPTVDASKALELASSLQLGRVHQTIAYQTSALYYKSQQATGQLTAAQTILDTANTLLENAKAQYDQGRATLPDVQNAQAGAAEAQFDLAAAVGEVRKSSIALTESIGVEPSPNLNIEAQQMNSPAALNSTVDELLQTAWRSRPDLLARAQQVRQSKDAYRIATAGTRPTLALSATGGQTTAWPTADFGQLGFANVSTWSVEAKLRWEIFNGARRHEINAAQAEERTALEEQRATRDAVSRQVWDAYVDYETAVEQVRASESFLLAAQTSYDSSLDAYKFGVRSLVDVVQAERQLAQARLANVRSQSQYKQSAVALGYATGGLLRSDATAPGVQP